MLTSRWKSCLVVLSLAGSSMLTVACGSSVAGQEVFPDADESDSSVDTSVVPEDDTATSDSTAAEDSSTTPDDVVVAFDSATADTRGDAAIDAPADSGVDSTVDSTVDSAADTAVADTFTVVDSRTDTVADTAADIGLDTGDTGTGVVVDGLATALAACTTTTGCGRWRLGEAPNATGTFTPYATVVGRSYPSYAADGGPLRWWSRTGSTLPFVLYNSGAATPYHPANKVSLHPGGGLEHSVIEWTAPLARTYVVKGTFASSDAGSKIVRVMVLGGTTLFTKTIAATETGAFDLSVPLTAGQVVRFGVDPNGGHAADTTMLDATVSWSADMIVCGSGSDGTACGSGMHCCSGSCVSNASTATCGTSCTACAVPANATAATCSGTACGFTCNASYGNCDGVSANGCERAITNDVNNCGACNRVCPNSAAPSTTNPGCTGTTCTLSCRTPYVDCDGTMSNGCEDLQNDINNCGTCGHLCPPESGGGIPTCSLGKCSSESACSAPYVDCNGNPGDGCETNTSNDINNCGFCGNRCGWMFTRCSFGVCG